MTKRDYLGEFEHIVVLALLRLGERAYGVTVRQEIEVHSRPCGLTLHNGPFVGCRNSDRPAVSLIEIFLIL